MRYVMILCLLVFAASLFADGPDGKISSGLVAHYYKDPKNWKGHWPDSASVPDDDPKNWTFTKYRYSRVEPLVNHLFIRRGWFSVRWVGYIDTNPPSGKKDRGDGIIRTPEEHDYKFHILADDGCRLFIDGKEIIGDWKARWEKSPEALRVSAPVKLTDGKHRIVIEYFQGQSLKRRDKDPMKLYWSCDDRGITKQVIPAARFSHTDSDRKSSSR